MSSICFEGVFPAVTTQFREDLSLDLEATGRHLEVIIDSGVQGLVMLGSLGENAALTVEEKLEVLKLAVTVSAGRVPVISGVAELNTAAACRWADQAEAAGVQGLMVLPCLVYKADRQETLTHFRTVSNHTKLPWILYNNPIGYGVDVTPEMLQELSDLPNLRAVKESSGDVRRITDIINLVGDRFTLMAGVDDLALECVFLGAKGWIAGIGLAFPKENQHLWNLMMAGKWEEARTLYRWYSPLLHLDVGLKFVQKIKLAIAQVGLGTEYVRLPRLPLTPEERAESMAIIEAGLAARPEVP